jgi:hypothetical protein
MHATSITIIMPVLLAQPSKFNPVYAAIFCDCTWLCRQHHPHPVWDSYSLDCCESLWYSLTVCSFTTQLSGARCDSFDTEITCSCPVLMIFRGLFVALSGVCFERQHFIHYSCEDVRPFGESVSINCLKQNEGLTRLAPREYR